MNLNLVIDGDKAFGLFELLICSILTNWMAEITCACIFAAVIAANSFAEKPLSIFLLSKSKTQQNINDERKPWIHPTRKPPDKSRSRQFILNENADAASCRSVAFPATNNLLRKLSNTEAKKLAKVKANPKRKPPDKQKAQLVLNEASWTSKRKRNLDSSLHKIKARSCAQETTGGSAVPAPSYNDKSNEASMRHIAKAQLCRHIQWHSRHIQ